MSTWKNKEVRQAYYRDRYKLRKDCIIKRLGGKCVMCGSTDRLELDHKDPQIKLYNFSHLFMLSEHNPWLRKELEKLQLLCYQCHRDKSGKEQEQLFCLRGHPRVPENLNGRACKICAREHSRKYKRFRYLNYFR